jgi:hypothetical protein
MRKSLTITILSLATLTMAAMSLSCTNQPPSNTNLAAAPTPEPAPDRAAIVTELTKIENDWPRIIKERDGAAVRRIEADDVTIMYPDGSLGKKEDDARDIEAGTMSANSWEVGEIVVNVINKDLATVTLTNEVKNGKMKSPDGRTADISGRYRSIDTFVRRNGQWQYIAMSTVKLQGAAAMASPSPKSSPAASTSPAMKASPAAPRASEPKSSPAKPAATP